MWFCWIGYWAIHNHNYHGKKGKNNLIIWSPGETNVVSHEYCRFNLNAGFIEIKMPWFKNLLLPSITKSISYGENNALIRFKYQ